MTATRRWGLVATLAAAAIAVTSCASGTSAGTPTRAPKTVYITAPGTKSILPTAKAAVKAPVKASTATTSSPTSTAKPKKGKPVGVFSTENDDVTYGVGMPLIIRFTKSPTNAAAFEKAAKVLLNGQPVAGAWYWEHVLKGEPIEAHFRPDNYWPHHSKISVDLPLKGVSAGAGLTYSNDLTLSYSIGDYHVSEVDDTTLRMTVYGDSGQPIRIMQVSLGKEATPTKSGIKVVMDKENPAHMVGSAADPYHENVPNSVRVTQDGEYVHPAPWNKRIGQVSSSHGCTNISVADGLWFYHFSQVGDIVQYRHTDGPALPTYDGYGDWNVDWATWQAGGDRPGGSR